MAVILTKEEKKKRIMISVIAVSIIGTFSVLYFGGIIGGGPKYITDMPEILPGEDSGKYLGSFSYDIDVKIFDDERFKSLMDPLTIPISTTTDGNRNPFSE